MYATTWEAKWRIDIVLTSSDRINEYFSEKVASELNSIQLNYLWFVFIEKLFFLCFLCSQRLRGAGRGVSLLKHQDRENRSELSNLNVQMNGKMDETEI